MSRQSNIVCIPSPIQKATDTTNTNWLSPTSFSEAAPESSATCINQSECNKSTRDRYSYYNSIAGGGDADATSAVTRARKKKEGKTDASYNASYQNSQAPQQPEAGNSGNSGNKPPPNSLFELEAFQKSLDYLSEVWEKEKKKADDVSEAKRAFVQGRLAPPQVAQLLTKPLCILTKPLRILTKPRRSARLSKAASRPRRCTN